MMKKFLLLLSMVCLCSLLNAQQLSLRSVNPRVQDARASSQPRTDAKGQKCAIIRVGVVGVENMEFKEAVGDVERLLSEYVVYVPDGLKVLNYKTKDGKIVGKIIFEDYGIDINSLSSYDVVFDTENHLRSAIFSLQPQNATLLVDGKKIDVNTDGIAIVNNPVGDYSYQVSAEGYEDQKGTFSLTDDDISTFMNVTLQEILYPVTINVFPESATVFIDNIPYAKESLRTLLLSGGKHSIRVTAPNYEDEERTITVKKSNLSENFTLKENKQEIVKHSDERSRTRVNIRNALYLTGGFSFTSASDIAELFKSDNAHDYSLEFSAVQHVGGIFAFREGFNIGMIKSNKNEKYIDFAYDEQTDSLYYMFRFDVPLQFGISLPLGKYNRHLFSVFGGGYIRYIIMTGLKETDYEFPADKTKNGDINDYILDFGLRVSAKFDIGRFTIGADVSQSLHNDNYGISAGINIGVKFYSLKKK